MKFVGTIPVWGEPMEDAVKQMQNCQKDAIAVALMADHHLGYAVPIGGVIAYDGKVSPSGVGFDIGCGNKAVRLDVPGVETRANIKKIMDDVCSAISFGVGRKNDKRVDHPLFESDAWKIPEVRKLKELAASQLGTVGSGNHYVDIFVDDQDRTWVGVHFGSRGLGHKLATYYIKAGGGKDGMFVDPVLIDVNTPLGEAYIQAMHLAGEYAHAGRDWVCQKVADLIGGKIVEEVHNHHNFAWEEEVFDGSGIRKAWVVRKGATPNYPGMKSFVGGSMGDYSYILCGREVSGPEVDLETHVTIRGEYLFSMRSTIHGAGRIMGRREAAGKTRFKNGQRVQISEGKISREMMEDWVVKGWNVELRGAGTDESPHCYKRIADVLKEHSPTTVVERILRPIGVAMAGANELDPYKD